MRGGKKVTLMLMAVCCFTLATALDPYFQEVRHATGTTVSVLAAFLGDSKRMFANHFFDKADAYFHSGYYPSIFDHPEPEKHSHIEEGHDEHGEHEEEKSFLGAPRDWIDRFGRNFYPIEHTHLEGGNEREMLPWLKLSAELDPQSAQTFVTGAYWLRRLHKPDEAEKFLRQGLAANPDSFEILLELGRVYASKNDDITARNLFRIALSKWRRVEAKGDNPDPEECAQIYGELARLDKKQNDSTQLLLDLQGMLPYSPDTNAIQNAIDQIKAQMTKPR